MLDSILAWLLTYLLHSTILLSLAWLFDAIGLLRRPPVAETAWRIALFGGLLSATLQAPLQNWFHRDATLAPSMVRTSSAGTPNNISAVQATSLTPRMAVGLPSVSALPLPPAPPEPPAVPAVADVLLHPNAALEANTLGLPIAQAAPFIVVPWLLLAMLGCLRIALAVRRLNTEVARCSEVDDDDVKRFVCALTGKYGRKSPCVRIADHWESPLVSPAGDICIPSWVLSELDRPQREAVLAHEVAHVIRRDPLWRVATHIVSRIGVLQPLNIVALRRLDAAAEYASDEWSAHVSGHRRALAEALFACAEHLHLRRAPQFAAAAIDCSSSLLSRVDSLLSDEPKSLPGPLRIVALTALAVCAAAVVAMPVIAVRDNMQPTRKYVQSGDMSMNINALHAEEHVARLQKNGGNALVLDEIRQIDNDIARSRYIEAFAADGKLQTDEVTQLLTLSAGIHSDVDRGRTYEAIIRNQMLDAQQVTSLVNALNTMRSDIDKHIVLDALAPKIAEIGSRNAQLSNAYVDMLQHMQSPIDRSAALIHLVQTTKLDRDGYAMVLSATEGMSADIETCQVLLAVAAVMPEDTDLLRHYRKISRTLGGVERTQAERALDRFDT